MVQRVRRVPLANGTRGGRNVQYASAGERAAGARILLSVFVSDKQPDTGIQERAVGTRSEVELDVLVAAEFAMENQQPRKKNPLWANSVQNGLLAGCPGLDLSFQMHQTACANSQ